MKHSQLAIFTNSPRSINVLETVLKNNTATSIKVYLFLSNRFFNKKIKKKFPEKYNLLYLIVLLIKILDLGILLIISIF